MNLKDYKLVWSDDFDYEGRLDENKWTYEVGNFQWPNKELQAYSDRLTNVFVKDGRLTIQSNKEQDGEREYTSGKINTKGKAHWKYGFFEVRAKFPKGAGSWPAIWLMPYNIEDRWPNCGEIDLVEHIGRRPDACLFSLHSGKHNHQRKDTIPYTTLKEFDEAFFDEYHNYQMEWTEDYFEFFIDDISYCKYCKSDDDGSYDAWPFDKEFFLIINTAVGGGLGGPVDDSTLPYLFEIKHVRVYQKS